MAKEGGTIQVDYEKSMTLRYNNLYCEAISISTKATVNKEVYHTTLEKRLPNKVLHLWSLVVSTMEKMVLVVVSNI